MYPLNLTKKHGDSTGFAVANTTDEHRELSAQGYQPAFVDPPVAPARSGDDEIDAVREKLLEAGIDYDKRWGLERLKALLPNTD